MQIENALSKHFGKVATRLSVQIQPLGLLFSLRFHHQWEHIIILIAGQFLKYNLFIFP